MKRYEKETEEIIKQFNGETLNFSNIDTNDYYSIIYNYLVENNKSLGQKGQHNFNLKIMKLAVLIHGIYLYKYDYELLHNMEAWSQGPVSNVLYAKLKQNDFEPKCEENEIDYRLLEVMNLVNKTYGKYSAEALVEITHQFPFWSNLKPQINRQKHIAIEKECIKRDMKILNNVTNSFYENIGDKEYTIIGDVTFCYEEEEKEEIANFIEDNYSEILKYAKNLRKEDNYLAFIERINNNYEITE